MKRNLILMSAIVGLITLSSCSKDEPAPADIYVAGHATNSSGNDVATVWKNGVAQSLSDGTRDAYAYSVYVSCSDVYVAGYEVNPIGYRIAKVWKNGVAQSLTDGTRDAYAYSIFVKQ